MELTVEKSGPLIGGVCMPGDKSISHRAAIISSLSSGECNIKGFSDARDCASTLRCLERFGVEIRRDGQDIQVAGRGGEGFEDPSGDVDAGNSATTMRLLTGALCGYDLHFTVTGDESLIRRPMGRIIEPLRLMGADITAGDELGHPPLKVSGAPLSGVDYSPPVSSAQVKSAILLAGLKASGRTIVTERVKTRDHTERMLGNAGIDIVEEGLSVTVSAATPEAKDLEIPGDFSSAAFFLAGASVSSDSHVRIAGVGLNPTRTGFLDILMRMGGRVDIVADEERQWEPRGVMDVYYTNLSAIELSRVEVAETIDEVPLVALMATQAEGNTRIIGGDELRHKESDRIKGTVENLAILGADIEETSDGMTIRGPAKLVGARVSSGRDHRIAMMLAIAGLIAEGKTTIEEWEWTEISYPGFAEVIKSLGGRLN